MSCYYRDGDYCEFCGRYGYSRISDAERITYARCSDDDYYYCPVANAFMEGELEMMEEEEAEKRAAEEEKKQREQEEGEAEEAKWRKWEEDFACEQQDREQQDPFFFDGTDLTCEEAESPGSLQSYGRSGRVCGVWKPTKLRELMVDCYGFMDFFSDMYTGGILTTVLLYILLFSGLIFAGRCAGAVLSVILPHASDNAFVHELLYCCGCSGSVVLFIAVFRAFHWAAIGPQIICTVLTVLVGGHFLKAGTIRVVLAIAGAISALMAIAGLLPGLLFMLVRVLIPETLFPYADWVLPGAAALSAALPVGTAFGKKLCLFHNFLARMAWR